MGFFYNELGIQEFFFKNYKILTLTFLFPLEAPLTLISCTFVEVSFRILFFANLLAVIK